MKQFIRNTLTVIVLTASSSTLFAQSAVNPDQIAPAAEVVLSPNFAPGVRSSLIKLQNNTLELELQRNRKLNRIWVASIVAMATATAMDAGTSWGKRESNSLLASSDGTFGAKGLSIKAGVALGVILPELLLRCHKDLKTKFAIGNFAEAALFGGVAIHNVGISAPK